MQIQVVFLHGLTGHYECTWKSLTKPPEFWPDWLADDVPGIAVWSVGYPAAASWWQRGSAMSLSDRAANLLPALANETKLTSGNIVLVGHSLGGLVIKEMMRQADSESPHKDRVASFLRRVRQVVFMGTPHLGSDQAKLVNALRLITRPRETLAGLSRNDTNLRALNNWFRNYCAANGVSALVFEERLPLRGLGTIVKPDSGDPGLGPATTVIPLDENHVSMVKLKSKNDDVYRHLVDFIKRGPSGQHADTLLDQRLEHVETTVSKGFDQVLHKIGEMRPRSLGGTPTLDNAATGRVRFLRRVRYFLEYDTISEARRLANDLGEGELSQASNNVRSVGLAWCAQILSNTGSSDEVSSLIERASLLGTCPEVAIASAFLLLALGQKPAALRYIEPLQGSLARTAAFFIASRDVGPEEALTWFSATGWKYEELDADGKLFILRYLLDVGDWAEALELTESIAEDDFEVSPMLLHVAATTYLIQALPDELKTNVLTYSPFYSGNLLLAGDRPALGYRRKAQVLYERMASEAESLRCPVARQEAADTALWLELRDPEQKASARQRLAEKLATPEESLHYVPLAPQLGIELDTVAVRREIERQNAITGGQSKDAALASFTLAQLTDDPRQIASHIAANRDALIEIIDPNILDGLHVHVLAASDQIPEAEALLAKMVGRGIDEAQQARLQRLIDQSKSADDSVSLREAQYLAEPSLETLTHLVGALERHGDWPRLVEYAGQLFELSRDLSVAALYVRSLAETASDRVLVEFFDRNPDLIGHSDQFAASLAWSLFRQGKLRRASDILADLRAKRDEAGDRHLLVNITIASGDWETLLPFVENEWAKRGERSDRELLWAGQLATRLNAPRARELIKEAAVKGSSDAGVLVGCYEAAVKGNWEDDPAVRDWLPRAAELSGDKGPLQRVSLEELLERQPQWEKRQNNTLEMFSAGNLPVFATAQALRRTVVDLTLMPMLANVKEPDVRRRSLVFGFSGTRGTPTVRPKSLALEPNALLTLAFTDLLDKVLNHFERLHVPHSTMGWLFDEVQHIEFHQPSRVTHATQLKELLVDSKLERFVASRPGDISLEQEVGADLAALIGAAEAAQEGHDRQHLVVRPYPVHKVSSLMKETTDLRDHAGVLCNCTDVVNALRQRGQLTASQEERALNYLSLHERSWPHPVKIEANAVLYLENLAVTHLLYLGLLDRLKAAGFTAFVDAGEMDEMAALIRHNSLAAETLNVIDRLRRSLSSAISLGKVELAEAMHPDDDDSFSTHPTAAILRMGGRADAVLVDDRFINQHANVEHAGMHTPIITTLDLVELLATEGAISDAERSEVRTQLRQAALCFIPITAEELTNALEDSVASNGQIVETAELRAIRENIARIRMANVLQLPKEQVWFDGFIRTFLECYRKCWNESLADDAARARSKWLLAMVDVRRWAHVLPNTGDGDLTALRYRQQLWSYLGLAATDQPTTVQRRYLAFLDDYLFAEIRDSDPETFEWITDQTQELIRYLSAPPDGSAPESDDGSE